MTSKKKIVALICAISMVSLLAVGCSSKTTEPETPDSGTEIVTEGEGGETGESTETGGNDIIEVGDDTDTDGEEGNDTATEESGESEAVEYNIETATLENENGTVNYPVVTGMVGELTMDYINQDLSNMAGNFINGETHNVQVDYEVTLMTNDILSILYTGTADYEGGQYQIMMPINFELTAEAPQIFVENLFKTDQASQEAVNQLFVEAFTAAYPDREVTVHGIDEWMAVYFTDDSVVFLYFENDNATEMTVVPVSSSLLEPYFADEIVSIYGPTGS